MSGTSPHRRRLRLSLLLALIAPLVLVAAVGLRFAFSGAAPRQNAGAGIRPSASAAQRSAASSAGPSVPQLLAERFRPVLWLAADDYRPADIRILVEPGEGGAVEAVLSRDAPDGQRGRLHPALTLETLCGRTDPADYLDLTAGRPRQAAYDALDQPEYRQRYAALAARHPPAVYARVATVGPSTVIQYWLFYVFNDWANNHEGDWEFVTLLFPAADPARIWREQLTPSRVAYSQHRGGTQREWGAIERWDGTERPVVYVGLGSHANQFRRGAYRYSQLTAVGAPGTEEARAEEPLTDYALLLLPTTAVAAAPRVCNSAEAVVRYGGRWGEPAWEECSIGCDGPVGPARHRAWQDPINWLASLPEDLARWPDCASLPSSTRADCYLPPTPPGTTPAP